MRQLNSNLLEGFWDRIYEEIRKQNISKKEVAKLCGFDRKTLYRPKNNDRYMCIAYFARLCARLNISADYLLFGERGEE